MEVIDRLVYFWKYMYYLYIYLWYGIFSVVINSYCYGLYSVRTLPLGKAPLRRMSREYVRAKPGSNMGLHVDRTITAINLLFCWTMCSYIHPPRVEAFRGQSHRLLHLEGQHPPEKTGRVSHYSMCMYKLSSGQLSPCVAGLGRGIQHKGVSEYRCLTLLKNQPKKPCLKERTGLGKRVLNREK